LWRFAAVGVPEMSSAVANAEIYRPQTNEAMSEAVTQTPVGAITLFDFVTEVLRL
jgi:hypothetical protein